MAIGKTIKWASNRSELHPKSRQINKYTKITVFKYSKNYAVNFTP
jgi:hypothetical protein